MIHGVVEPDSWNWPEEPMSDQSKKTLTLHEALILCRDEGKKVKAKCWDRSFPGQHVEYRGSVFQIISFLDEGETIFCSFDLGLSLEAELLGPWEVVE